ncbi:helix-turn-helix domain-containing protein [Virgibacillus sp. DJP39]|uniref:helix-turn-helix domain-containing protein n=1 Tax=Virgibacillus sp. DJP39 TaxID=3409790 RepID=UPI003BB4B357
MRVAIEENMNIKEIEREAENIVTDIINYIKGVNEYIGVGSITQKDVTTSTLYKDIVKILEGRSNLEIDEEILIRTERVKKVLSNTPYQQIWNSNLETFNKTKIGEAIVFLENTNFMESEYITQSEASNLLGKDIAHITNMIHRFEPRIINDRRMVRRSSVIAYKNEYEARNKFKTNEEYMSADEVANELNFSIHFIYKLLKEGELSKYAVSTAGVGLYIEKKYVEEYKKRRDEQRKKYNMFDFLGTQETALILFNKTPATISNWIKKGILKNSKKVGRNYEIPRSEVLRVMKEEGYENADTKVENRDRTLFQYIKIYTRALKDNDKQQQEGILDLAEKKGFKDYMKVTREAFNKGEEVYIPDWVLEEYENEN